MAYLTNFSFDFFYEIFTQDSPLLFYTMVQKKSKMTKNSNQGVLSILVIFGRRALIFFLFESSWKKMKNDATLMRMRSGDHLGDAKMSKKGTSLRRI